ncbi:flavin-containing monooxygenase [Nonomuraea lactucae]|uniref:flavin-containing monooxygenase n=1 Tax=Nonomuraea lactucae TaxID=2249762 RepID=UPI0019657BC6|nr:NAD(P)/FAD-dependent oxidoreductase [Nonomuraea lactucae]
MDDAVTDTEVVVVGTGVSGLAALHHLKARGVDVVALERNPDVGGTWYHNRYPGCRFDSESYTYGYSFSQEVLREWHWKERYSPQPENLRYLRFVTEKLALRDVIRFNTTVTGAHWEESTRTWVVHIEGGRSIRSRFLMTCLGMLSTPTMPRVDGIDTFEGPSFHTFDWPKDGIDLRGKRVGVVGTGATGVQAIAAIAPEVASLTVFQRRPNWHTPLGNSEITVEEMAEIRSRYDEIFALCAVSPGGYVHQPDRRGFHSLTAEQRRRFWEELYAQPGFAVWLANFREIFVDREANAEFSAFVAEKVRERVHDPELAEKLIPKDHGFGVQRVPLETNYYEVYNRDNVRLVDLQQTPMVGVTLTGIKTTEEDFELDVIVYATGFDAITGPYEQLDIRGVGGRLLKDKWVDGPETYLGLLVRHFPNLLMVAGPQSSSSSVNFPRSIEAQVDWCMGLLDHLRRNGLTRLEPTAEAEREWVAYVAHLYEKLLMREARSWFTGYNSNIPGREHGQVRHVMFNGGQPKYREILDAVASSDYRELVLS